MRRSRPYAMGLRVRLLASALFLSATSVMLSPQSVRAQSPTPPAGPDSLLVARIEAALEAASDLPADSITVSASDGVVTVTGSLVCADCGGTRTPSGTGTVQQSLGAVIRAVPGVERVLFDLVYGRP